MFSMYYFLLKYIWGEINVLDLFWGYEWCGGVASVPANGSSTPLYAVMYNKPSETWN